MWKKQREELKDKPLKVSYEYEPTPDSEERLIKIFEFLLSKNGKFQTKK